MIKLLKILILTKMSGVGLEPTKLTHCSLNATPLTTRASRLMLLVHGGTRTHNLKIRSLTRYPIAPTGHELTTFVKV